MCLMRRACARRHNKRGYIQRMVIGGRLTRSSGLTVAFKHALHGHEGCELEQTITAENELEH